MADHANTRGAKESGDASGASQTDWSMILQAAQGASEPARAAWEVLARRYWPAIYAYARSCGLAVEEAADITQGFVCDIMLKRRLVESADPARGRFRSLLLTSLRNYMSEDRRYHTRRKRSPGGDEGRMLLELDHEELHAIVPVSGATPEAAFTAQWSAALVHRVLERVRRECLEEELAAHWAVFESRVVGPMLNGSEPTSYSVLVDTLDLRDGAQASNMMITVKRRFARALHREVGETVSGPDVIEDELLTLLRVLERPS